MSNLNEIYDYLYDEKMPIEDLDLDDKGGSDYAQGWRACRRQFLWAIIRIKNKMDLERNNVNK